MSTTRPGGQDAAEPTADSEPQSPADEEGQFSPAMDPAVGKWVQIAQVNDPGGGPCVPFGILRSFFDAHVNQASLSGKMLAIRCRAGKLLNALRRDSTTENENREVIIHASEPDPRIDRIRQITRQLARRIVSGSRPGDILERGEMHGMIKLGSRTEILVPDSESLMIVAKVGDTGMIVAKVGDTGIASSTICAKLNIGTVVTA